MHSKRHLIVKGASIPAHQPGENVTIVFIQCIGWEVGIYIRPDDLGQVHRLGNGFIAEFINRKFGSPFQRLLRFKPNNDLQIEMRLIADDQKILIKARQMLNNGLLDSVYVDPISGKVTVIIGRTGRVLSISDERRINDLKNELENLRQY